MRVAVVRIKRGGRYARDEDRGERGGERHGGDERDRADERRDNRLGDDLAVERVAEADVRVAQDEDQRQ
jgi:hypothetical protein